MIDVVVVESHNHALEHIHTALRQRRLLNQDWTMLHFDAHADLACPGQHIPAISCYRPQMTIRMDELFHRGEITKFHDSHRISNEALSENADTTSDDDVNSTDGKNLYELLDSTSSGIAEWILPLILAANLRSICWVRAPNSIPLIPSGIHHYHVGVHVKPENRSTTVVANPNLFASFLDLPPTALVKVDWDCRYYLEDDSYVPTADLVLTQPLQLTVKEYPEKSNVSNHADCKKLQKSKTIVDSIANTIFAVDVCLDYFMCCNPFLTDIESRSSAFAKALYDAFTQSKLYSSSYDTAQSTENFSVELFAFRQHFTKLLESLPSARLQEDQLKALMPFYDNSKIAGKLFDILQNAFDGTIEEYKSLIELSVEALPYLSMPHTTLELGKLDESLIQQRLMHMRSEILEHSTSTSDSMNTPFIVTVARSTEDGFTPREVVDHLQEIVLNEIHSIYCGCSNMIQARPSLLSSKSSHNISLTDAQICSWNLVLDY